MEHYLFLLFPYQESYIVSTCQDHPGAESVWVPACKERGLETLVVESHPVPDELLYWEGVAVKQVYFVLKNIAETPHKWSPVNKCITYFTAHTNINTNAGLEALQVSPGATALILCLWDEGWCGFLQLLNNLIKDPIKFYNLLWEMKRLALHTWEYLSFHLVLLSSFYTLFFPPKDRKNGTRLQD